MTFWNFGRRIYLELQYDHLRASIDALQLDMQGHASFEQQQRLARQQAKAFRLVRRISQLRATKIVSQLSRMR